MTDQRDSESPNRIGPYRRTEVLGEGGMGTVYLGEHVELGRKAAVKLVHSERLRDSRSRQRFEREMRTLSRLDHPNICKVYEVGVDGDVPFMALQWVRGETLAERLAADRLTAGSDPARRRDARPSSSTTTGPDSREALESILVVIEKLAGALHTAHEAGVLHRDVKPGNVMITPDGEPVLLDFGLAREVDQDSIDATSSAAMVGTLPFMAPEQIRPQGREVDARTDVYGLGVVLYECLTLQLPYLGTSYADLMNEILRAAPIPARRINRAVPADLQIVLEKAMDPDPDRRYRSALAFADDLRRIREYQPIEASRLGWGLRTRRWTQRNPVASMALTLTTVGLCVVTYLLLDLSVARAQEREAREQEQVARAEERLQAAETAMQAATLATRDGRWGEALSHYDHAESLGHPDEVALQLGRLDAYDSLSQSREATDVLTWLREREVTDSHAARARLMVGVDELDHDVEAGLRIIDDLLESPQATELSDAERAFANSLLADDLDGAIAGLEEALAADPRYMPARTMLGPLLLFTGEPGRAVRFARDYALLFPDAPEPVLIRSMGLACGGRFAEAHDALPSRDEPTSQVVVAAKAVIDVLELLDTELDSQVLGATGWLIKPRAQARGSFPMPPGVPTGSGTNPLQKLLLIPRITSLTAGLRESSLAESTEGGPRLRFHPWIRRRYFSGITEVGSLVMHILGVRDFADFRSLRATLPPERMFVVFDLTAETTELTEWDLTRPEYLAQHRGITAGLPAVERLINLTAYAMDVVYLATRKYPDGTDSEAVRADMATRVANALGYLRLHEQELIVYVAFTLRFELPERFLWAERLLRRWRELHGDSLLWTCARAEVELTRGASDEAKAWLAKAAALDEDHPWVGTLRERLE